MSADAETLAPGGHAVEQGKYAKAILDILGDFAQENMRLHQKALLNVQEDSRREQERLADTQRAFLNIMEDSADEKQQLESMQRAVLNILDDAAAERAQLETTQRAVMNILDDVSTERSDREKAEAQVRALNKVLQSYAAELESSNRDLQYFAYVASHDLQEPLRMVVGYVQLLEKRLADKLDQSTREFMGYAVDGALRMQSLIQDILAYSRVSTKGQPLEPVDSAAALKEALDRLASRIAETGAEVDARSLPIVMADRTQLAQLFQNLIGNAIKFCRDHAPQVRVEAAREAGRWRFSVTDNGIGIAPEYRERLFVIFKRLHTQREFPGTGIGLAICKRIIERHGGEIGIGSAPGGGSVFWFTLPE